jgi:hypothetical protein
MGAEVMHADKKSRWFSPIRNIVVSERPAEFAMPRRVALDSLRLLVLRCTLSFNDSTKWAKNNQHKMD